LSFSKQKQHKKYWSTLEKYITQWREGERIVQADGANQPGRKQARSQISQRAKEANQIWLKWQRVKKAGRW